jgi:hypothetical protein
MYDGLTRPYPGAVATATIIQSVQRPTSYAQWPVDTNRAQRQRIAGGRRTVLEACDELAARGCG